MASASHGARKPENKRRGRTKGYGGQKGGAHQVTWCDDPIILDRIRIGLKPWMERRSPLECLEVIRTHMADAHPNEPPISARTMYEDRQRAGMLITRDLEALRSEHVAELDHVIRRAWELFELTAQGHAALLGTISQTIERKAKVDGTLNPKAIAIGSLAIAGPSTLGKVDVDMSDETMARILATAMDLRESHGLIVDTGAGFISPLPALNNELDKEGDDGIDDYVERL